MDWKIRCGFTAILTYFAQSSLAFAQTPAAATPMFLPAPGAIVSGLSGLVTGTQQALSGDRTGNRTLIFRLQLTNWLINAPPNTTNIPLAALNSNGNEYVLSNNDILCTVRGKHAITAADATYIDAVTGTLDKFATPPKIATITDALSSVFQNYSIGAPSGKTQTETSASVVQHCQDDIRNWPSSVYGRPISKPQEVAASVALPLDIGGDISAVFSLYQAVVAIITPIVVTPAQALDAQRRAAAITNFLKTYRTTLLKAASDLATTGSSIATTNRLQALGQFAEKMSELRSANVDLSKIDACKSGMQNPVLRTDQIKDQNGNTTNYYIPTDAFVMCYEQAWQQILPAVQAAVSAAAQYDVFADASSDQLGDAVKTIQDNLDKLDQPQNVNISDLWTAAAQLVAYGQAVSKALSPDNLKNVQTDVNNVMKLFGGK